MVARAEGVQGDKGDTGNTRAAGTNGTNGTALGYTRLAGSTSPTFNDSSNMTGATVTRVGTGQYCIKNAVCTSKCAGFDGRASQ